ncbi:meiotic recombination protein SPO11-1 isoform X5 [Citrus sinensis]|uniref:meiotic recombination protein SPO11-1 isoform X5 n=1 Tax=Citrus sinensis TaxID=2711 RepID=UPI002278097C|nr:meiotic recombination protein SPO11-1 isoform X5 [Citrus sinensis]
MLKWKQSKKMEGNRRRSHLERHDLLRKIKEFCKSILKDITERRSLSISINQFRNYCKNLDAHCSCSYDFPQGQEILTLEKQCHARRIEQSIVDQAINDICILLQCSRHNINVVSAGKGMVMGWLRFLESGAKFDCINSPNDAHPIPTFVEKVKDIVSTANYILVVEKESVFHRLANDQYCTRNRCIVITGRGYPDISTRRFLRLLIEKLRLPTFCLVDCDPYGFDILTTYRFGSMQMAYDAKFLRIPEMHWLGAFPSDFEKYGLPKNCRLKLTVEDTRKTEAMLHRCYLQREVPHWRSELELMLQSGVKFEIEAFCACSFSFLSEKYIPSKIQEFERLAV